MELNRSIPFPHVLSFIPLFQETPAVFLLLFILYSNGMLVCTLTLLIYGYS